MDPEKADEAITAFFGDSGAQLKLTLKSISDIAPTDLGTVGTLFDETYRVLFAWVLATAFIGMFVTAIWSFWRVMSGTGAAKNPWKAPLIVFAVGMFLPGAILIIRVVTNALSKFIMDYSGTAESWQDALTQNYSVANLFSKAMYAAMNWLARKLLEAEVFVLSWSLPVLVCILLVSYGMAMTFKGKAGTFSRWFLSIVIVAIIAQPVMLFFLGLSGRALAASNISEDWKAFIVVLIQLVTGAVVFLLVWWTHTKVDSFIQDRLEVRGDVDANIVDDHTAAAGTSQVLSQRFAVMDRNDQSSHNGQPKDTPTTSATSGSQDAPSGTHKAVPAGIGAVMAGANVSMAGAKATQALNTGGANHAIDAGLTALTVAHPVVGTGAKVVHSYLKNKT